MYFKVLNTIIYHCYNSNGSHVCGKVNKGGVVEFTKEEYDSLYIRIGSKEDLVEISKKEYDNYRK